MKKIALPFLVLMSLPAFSGNWQGAKAFESQDYQRAANEFRSSQWRGAANYRAGNYDKAVKDFGYGKSSIDFYNLGNAQAKSHLYEEAIKSYEQALLLNPDNPDAKHNKALLEKLLQKQQQEFAKANPKKNVPNENEKKISSKASQEPANSRQSHAQKTPEKSSSFPSPNQEKNNQKHDMVQGKSERQIQAENRAHQGVTPKQVRARIDEEQQADMQWMQQIVDDPGGLLRRKFLRDHQRRLQQARGW